MLVSDNDEASITGGVYDEPQERLTRIAGAMTQAMTDHPEHGDDLRLVVMLHDDKGGSGSALYGYPEGEELSAESLTDVVKHLSALFRAAGISMDVKTVPGETGPEEPSGQAPKVVLTLSSDALDPQLRAVCDAVKEAVEATSGTARTKMVVILNIEGGDSALMHHGHDSQHQVAHALFDTFRTIVAAEGGHIAVIPVMDPGILN